MKAPSYGANESTAASGAAPRCRRRPLSPRAVLGLSSPKALPSWDSRGLRRRHRGDRDAQGRPATSCSDHLRRPSRARRKSKGARSWRASRANACAPLRSDRWTQADRSLALRWPVWQRFPEKNRGNSRAGAQRAFPRGSWSTHRSSPGRADRVRTLAAQVSQAGAARRGCRPTSARPLVTLVESRRAHL